MTTRILLFIPTNFNVFKFGFNKNIIFEAVDLSKLQINISNRAVNKKKFRIKENVENKNINIWTFGGSTTYGDNCGSSSSWVKELLKINDKININNFAFNGADSDQLVAILNINLEKKQPPEIVIWASKFNMNNILAKNDYRNKDILNYEFNDTKKNKIAIYIKRIDKSLKSYLLSYNLLDAVILRLNSNKNIIKKELIDDKHIEMMVKNFEINTNEAIELSKLNGVKEFYLVSLFSKSDFRKKNHYKFILYDNYLKNVNKKYFGYLKVIDLTKEFLQKDEEYYLCDEVHQNLEGNIYQAEKINDFLMKNSQVFK